MPQANEGPRRRPRTTRQSGDNGTGLHAAYNVAHAAYRAAGANRDDLLVRDLVDALNEELTNPPCSWTGAGADCDGDVAWFEGRPLCAHHETVVLEERERRGLPTPGLGAPAPGSITARFLEGGPPADNQR